ncbi:NUDIX domain-containing protein [Actinoplanes sp. NPDC049599]|uniref:NUDIX domain-containing protein n=1 Tax=Actinoplanes sp. NPDC049599 TaxID=3363903 RepID=UPI00379C47C3
MTSEWTATLPRKRMGAALLFRDPADRVLLVEPTYKPHWELPGGVVEADESPRDAAAREITEELGLAVVPGRLLVVDWVPPRDGRTDGLMLVFDGGRFTDPVRLDTSELRSWAWCDPDEATQRLLPLLARRAAAALQAARTRTTAYLEDGRAPPPAPQRSDDP